MDFVNAANIVCNVVSIATSAGLAPDISEIQSLQGRETKILFQVIRK